MLMLMLMLMLLCLVPPEQTEKNGDDCEAKTEPPVGTGTAHWVGLSRVAFVFHTVVTVVDAKTV